MKHVLRVACAGAWLLAITASVSAESTFGMAGVQCSQYTKAARGSDILYHQASQWLLGYVSGMNGALKAMNGAEPGVSVSSDQALKSAIVLSSAASAEFRPREALIASVLLAAVVVGVFVYGLHLQLPIWPGTK